VIAESFDHPALGKTREALQSVEDDRSKHAGAVAASDAELERVRRDREAKSKQYITDLAAAEGELTEVTKKLEPLEKEAAAVRKRGDNLRDQLRRIEKKIADTEAQLVAVTGDKMDRAAIQADIATLKADRQAVKRDEPALAAELDALNPQIAKLEATRGEAEKKKTEVVAAELEDQRRTTELFEAIGAKRKVVERAAADAEAARDRVLFDLGERLYVDRPETLSAQLSPVDQIDLELGETDRRVMELKEILSNVDRAKFARGMLVIVLALAVLGAGGWLVYYTLA
jgi:chromosome segregation ATPase